jgi:hypothetical protein
MGDSRIRILVHSDAPSIVHQALSSEKDEGQPILSSPLDLHSQAITDEDDSKFEQSIIHLPADSTLRDLTTALGRRIFEAGVGDAITQDDIFQQLLLSSSSSGPASSLVLFDCTYHPPKELSYTTTNNQQYGPHSITLQTLGWFPSGTVALFPTNDDKARNGILTSSLSNNAGLELGTFRDASPSLAQQTSSASNEADSKPTSKMLPSQVFAAVEQRFGDSKEDAMAGVARGRQDAAARRRKMRQKEQQRCAKLDAILKRLEFSSSDSKKSAKQAKLSSKVKSMLIKSRAKGEDRIQQQDRFYLEVAVVMENVSDGIGDHAPPASTSDLQYKFFSRVATVGKVTTSCFSSTSNAKDPFTVMEFLVKRPENENGSCNTGLRYFRLPNTMALHEAESKGFLQQFEPVIMRQAIASSSLNISDLETPSIMQRGQDDPVINDPSSDSEMQIEPTETNGAPTEPSHSVDDAPLGSTLDQRSGDTYDKAIESHLASSNKSKTKKTINKTSDKVRHMLIKSKAKGESKRVPMPDRMFIEAVIFCVDDDASGGISVQSISPFYFSYSRDTMKELIVASKIGTPCEFLVRVKTESAENEGSAYSALPSDISLQEAIMAHGLENFDRVLLIPKP